MRTLTNFVTWLTVASAEYAVRQYTNPILPGWNSDPSCIYVKDYETFFCSTSTFLTFPGLPIYASKDLTQWRLASYVFSRAEQRPAFHEQAYQQGGMFAATLRYQNGTFYLAVTDFAVKGFTFLLFNTTDPFSSWGDPTISEVLTAIDPDLFFLGNGSVLTAVSDLANKRVAQATVDLHASTVGNLFGGWTGTGGSSPEGPHIYDRLGTYYMIIAEGGTEMGHSVTVARSSNLTGPWEGSPRNPVLTARGTNEYFQTVGHADLFEDGNGQWWAVALATRCGLDYTYWPMGRETVLTPVQWEQNDFPAFLPVRGRMSGRLPPLSRAVRGSVWLGEDDIYDFPPGSKVPENLLSWRKTSTDHYNIPAGGGLELKLSRATLSGSSTITDGGLSFLGRKQTDTRFRFSVIVDFVPKDGEEAGVTAFLNQDRYFSLGLIQLQDSLSMRFRYSDVQKTVPVPEEWLHGLVQLQIEAVNTTTYVFTAASACDPEDRITVAYGNSSLLSAGFTGTLVGVYATSNGAESSTSAYFGEWRYTGLGQYIGE